MSLITSKTNAAPAYVRAKAAQEALTHAFREHRTETLQASVYNFEDVMNGLSGELLNLPSDQLTAIRNENYSLSVIGKSIGFPIALHSSVLPPVTSGNNTNTVYRVDLAKKLYPLTISVPYSQVLDPSYVPPETTLTVTPNVITDTPLTDAEEEALEETIDPLFDELDAEETVEEPLSVLQNETAPYLSNSLVEIALTAAEYEPLQAGLVEFSQNPLADLIADARGLLIYYTEGNYANLNTALSVVYANASLNTAFESFKEALGGPDGLSGCVVQLDIFKEHTDRLAGLNLDSASPNDETDNDSTSEYLNLNDIASGSPQVLFRFDARRFRSAKYLIQASAANTSRGHQATEIYILHDNHHAYTREIISVYSNEPFCTYTTRLLNANVEVLANTSVPNTDFVVSGTRLRIARQANAYGEISQNKIIEQHEILSAYLDDGVDYVELQSASLLKGNLVANLARDFRDALSVLADSQWNSQSVAAKQAGIANFTNTLKADRAAIQDAIDTDYNEFVSCRKKAEALDIAYNLSVAYTDENGTTIPTVTLNSATKAAIEESE